MKQESSGFQWKNTKDLGILGTGFFTIGGFCPIATWLATACHLHLIKSSPDRNYLTCRAKNIVSSLESLTIDPSGSSPGLHLKRKIRP